MRTSDTAVGQSHGKARPDLKIGEGLVDEDDVWREEAVSNAIRDLMADERVE